MNPKPTSSIGIGLERSCGQRSSGWIRHTDVVDGVERMEAWFRGPAYQKHRHDTYAIGVTDVGVQAFDYRGSAHISTPGEVFVLHPDEMHDGNPGTDEGFGYRQLYVDPTRIFEAVRVLSGRTCSLPFVRDPVATNTKLTAVIQAAFRNNHEPLATDDLIVRLAEGLLESDPSCSRAKVPRHLDLVALDRARAFLDAEKTRVVRSWEVERVTGLSRYELARQFRLAVGTSPYRYHLMRRLDYARSQISQKKSLVDISLEAGFSDQAHFTRMFTSTFGLTPARYRTLEAD
jgi:AraC-like DNA-binding protein